MLRSARSRLRLAVALAVPVPAGCLARFLWPGDVGPLAAIADELAVPASWERVLARDVAGGFIVQSQARRYYFVDADATEIVPLAQRVARGAGFAIHDQFEVCPDSNGGTCIVEGYREPHRDAEPLDHLWITISNRNAYISDQVDGRDVVIRDPDRSLVTISVDRKPRKFFWASPTPRPAG
jgi:hypothetical protein